MNLKNWKKWACIIALIGAIQHFIVITIAMFFYPGGTSTDPNTIGYSYWRNYISDLLATTAHSGESNLVSFVFAVSSTIFLGIVIVLCAIAIPFLFIEGKAQKISALIGSFFGILAGIFAIAVALAPGDIYPTEHFNSSLLLYVSFFFLSIFLTIGILIQKSYSNKYAIPLVIFDVIFVVYLILVIPISSTPGIYTPQTLLIACTGQKILAYAQMISFGLLFYSAWEKFKSLEVITK